MIIFVKMPPKKVSKLNELSFTGKRKLINDFKSGLYNKIELITNSM